MPKQVDHAQRREELAGALWRLVLREGVEAASMRRVAEEAGWSVGSLRHYFATQSELLEFALELVTERVGTRLAGLPEERDGRAAATRLLSEVLPLDADRRAEMHVWLAFTSRALVDPELRGVRDEAHTALRQLCSNAIELTGAPASAAETERLHALIDGLALHATLAPAVTTPERQLELLNQHLDGLDLRTGPTGVSGPFRPRRSGPPGATRSP